MNALKNLWKLWCFFCIAIGPLGGVGLGMILGNVIEMYMHDVSFYDAAFIESWSKDVKP